MFRILFLILCTFFVSACTGSAYQLPKMTTAEVKEMQEKISAEDRPLQVYQRSDAYYKSTLAAITKRLEKNAKPLCEDSGYAECYFKVDYNPEMTVNAYASEGYKIVIYKGILQYLKTSDEMAAVVAHEMGHHLAKHNEETRNNAVAGAAVTGILTAVILGAANANNPYSLSYEQQRQQQKTIENMMNLGAYVGIRSYSKEQEREADLLATYLLSRSGYSLSKAQNAMVVLARFAGEEASNPTHKAFLESHPAGAERVVAWRKAMEEIQSNPSKLPYPKVQNNSNRKDQ